jgi:cysteine synthase A
VSHLVLVESNTTGTGRLAVERLLAAGDCVTFLTRSRGRYPFLAACPPRLEVVEIETNEVEAVVSAVAGLRRRREIDAVLTFSDFYVAIVAEAAARLGYRYLSAHPARTCRNKPQTRRALAAAGLPTPDFWLVASEEAARALLPDLRFPCVVKPPADSSSFGVRAAGTAAELLAQVRLLVGLAENVRGQRLDGTVLIESYLAGAEYSVETVSLADGSVQVVGVTDKLLSPLPHFVELGHDFPSAADPATRSAIEAAAIAALAAVEFDFGPAHTEVRWTPRGPVVVEINPRLAGGMIPELVRYAVGIDLLDGWLDLLRGRTPDLTPNRDDVAAIRFLTANRRGRLAGVAGVEAARRLPAIREVLVEKPPGAPVQPTENAYHRLGFVIAAGACRQQVLTEIAEAMRLLRVEVVPEAAQLAGRTSH